MVICLSITTRRLILATGPAITTVPMATVSVRTLVADRLVVLADFAALLDVVRVINPECSHLGRRTMDVGNKEPNVSISGKSVRDFSYLERSKWCPISPPTERQ